LHCFQTQHRDRHENQKGIGFFRLSSDLDSIRLITRKQHTNKASPLWSGTGGGGALEDAAATPKAGLGVLVVKDLVLQAVDKVAEGLLAHVVLDLGNRHLAENLALPENEPGPGVLLEVVLDSDLGVGDDLLDGEGNDGGNTGVILVEEDGALGVLDEVIREISLLDVPVSVEDSPLDGELEEELEVGPAEASRALNAAGTVATMTSPPSASKAEVAVHMDSLDVTVPVHGGRDAARAIARHAPLPARSVAVPAANHGGPEASVAKANLRGVRDLDAGLSILVHG